MRIFYFETSGNYPVTPGDYVFYPLDDHKSILRQVTSNVRTLTGNYENDKDYLSNVIDPNEEELVTKSWLLSTILNYRTQSTTHAFWNYALEYTDDTNLPINPGLYILPASVVNSNQLLPDDKLIGLDALLRVTDYKENQVIFEFIQSENGDRTGHRRYAVLQFTKDQTNPITKDSWTMVVLNYDGNTIPSLMNQLNDKIAYLNTALNNRMVPSLVINEPEGTNTVTVSFNDGTFEHKGLIITYGFSTPHLGHELNTLTLKDLSSNQGQIYLNSALGLKITEILNESGVRDILIQSTNTNTCLIYNVYKIDII